MIDGPSLVLRLDHLDTFGQLSWIAFCARLLDVNCLPHVIALSPSDLSVSSREALAHNIPLSAKWRFCSRLSAPDPSERFVYASGSAVLGSKLLAQFRRIFVRPRGLPSAAEPVTFWRELADPVLFPVLRGLAQRAGTADSLDNLGREFRLSARKVSLLSSVFNGDHYLDGFLKNISALADYEEHEHLLIRAASPGSEHARLIEHVEQFPSAVYVNLDFDPGLYEVWNLGACIANGRYLSTANLDDRRCPVHLQKLTGVLDSRREIDVASAAIRVTTTPNLSWSRSGKCKVWYRGVGYREGEYSWEKLFRRLPDGRITSRTLPHCMPVWRRTLHGRSGLFRESLFGPSADWEFWLRAGRSGARFYLLPEALGLYLRAPDSYWKVANRGKNFDSHIINLYFPEQAPDREPTPFGIETLELNTFVRYGSWLNLFQRLVALQQRVQSSSRTMTLLDGYASTYLGVSDFAEQVRGATTACPWPHVLGQKAYTDFTPRVTSRWFSLLADYGETGNRAEAAVGMANICCLQGNERGASQLLREVQDRYPDSFAVAHKMIFDFNLPLREIECRSRHNIA